MEPERTQDTTNAGPRGPQRTDEHRERRLKRTLEKDPAAQKMAKQALAEATEGEDPLPEDETDLEADGMHISKRREVDFDAPADVEEVAPEPFPRAVGEGP